VDFELGVFFGGLSLRDEARVEPDKDRLRGFVLEGDNLLVACTRFSRHKLTS